MLKDAPNTAATRPVVRAAGELWALGAVFGYTGANLFGRAGVTQGNPLAAPILRDLPSLVMGLILLVRGGHYRQALPGREEFVGRRLLPFVGSGIASVAGTFAFFFALNLGGVNIAVPVIQTQIMWGALFGAIILGERLKPAALVGMAITFAGLVVLAVGQSRGVPVSPGWYWGLLLALVPALGWGFSGVIWRHGQQRGVDRSTGITVHYGTSVLASLVFLLVSGRLDVYATLAPSDLGVLLASGLFGGVIAVYSMFNAMRLLPAATVYVLNGLTPLFTALGGALLLGEYVNGPMWLGIGVTSAGVAAFQLATYRAKGGRNPAGSGAA